MTERRIGLYGGTFDPIHFGHLNIAIQMKEFHHLDEIWFSLANRNPHKEEASESAQHRLKMLEIALAEIPNFRIIDNELKRNGPSYTIDTLRELVSSQEKHVIKTTFFLILGEDSALNFSKWREPREIVKLATPLVARRTVLEKSHESQSDPVIEQALKKGITPIPVMEICATDIRKRVQEGLYIGHLVPSKVIDYIYQNHLYYYN